MTIEHINIPDAQRHEPRGASTAVNGTVLFSIGAGATEFRAINFNDIIGIPVLTLNSSLEIESQSLVAQTTTANVGKIVAYGAAVATDNVDLDALGVVTFLTEGTYIITVDLAVELVSGTGGTGLYIRESLNGANGGRVLRTKTPLQITRVLEAGVGDTFQVEFLRASSNWGLQTSTAPTNVDWDDDSASAVIRIYSFNGSP